MNDAANGTLTLWTLCQWIFFNTLAHLKAMPALVTLIIVKRHVTLRDNVDCLPTSLSYCTGLPPATDVTSTGGPAAPLLLIMRMASADAKGQCRGPATMGGSPQAAARPLVDSPGQPGSLRPAWSLWTGRAVPGAFCPMDLLNAILSP